MAEKSYPLMSISLWKDITIQGEPVRIEASWYDDVGEIENLIDIKIRQAPSVTEKGLFLSCRRWRDLCIEVNDLLDKIRGKIAKLQRSEAER